MEKQIKEIEKLTKNLLTKIGFDAFKVKVEVDENERIQINIQVSPEESGLLIGYRGETISALQLVLSQLINSKLDSWKKISVNIGDYREKRREALETMAKNSARRAKELNTSVTLPYLIASERRIIHLILSEDDEIETHSEGEGRQRRLVVSVKKPE